MALRATLIDLILMELMALPPSPRLQRTSRAMLINLINWIRSDARMHHDELDESPPGNPRESTVSVVRARVSDHAEVGPGIHRMDLETPQVARAAMPGQFLQVRPPWGHDPLLPRPFSVHRRLTDTGGEPRGVSILYRVVGRGTRLLAGVRRGDEVKVLGPLGRGFDLSGLEGRSALVAGGMGAAPLLFLAEEAAARVGTAPRSTEVILGAPNAEALVAESDFRRTGLAVSVATDDGSAGFRGTVVDLLLTRLEAPRPPERVFAVGPESMYRGLREALKGRDVSCQISMERRMACGVGACRSCVVLRAGDGGKTTYVDVCRRGPVFDLKEVEFDDGLGKKG